MVVGGSFKRRERLLGAFSPQMNCTEVIPGAAGIPRIVLIDQSAEHVECLIQPAQSDEAVTVAISNFRRLRDRRRRPAGNRRPLSHKNRTRRTSGRVPPFFSTVEQESVGQGLQLSAGQGVDVLCHGRRDRRRRIQPPGHDCPGSNNFQADRHDQQAANRHGAARPQWLNHAVIRPMRSNGPIRCKPPVTMSSRPSPSRSPTATVMRCVGSESTCQVWNC